MQRAYNENWNSIRISILLRKIRIKLITGDMNDVKDMLDEIKYNDIWLSDRYNHSVYLMLKGESHRNNGSYKEAYDAFIAASELKNEIDDETGYASCMMNAATMLKRLGDYDLAIKYYNIALSIYMNHNQRLKYANTLLNIFSLMIQSNPEEIDVNQLMTLETTFIEYKVNRSLAIYYEMMADYHHKIGDNHLSQKYLDKGMHTAKESNLIYTYANLHLKKGVFNYLSGNRKRSVEDFSEGLNILNNYEGYQQLKILLNYNIADVYNELNDKQRALNYYQYVYENDINKSDMFEEAETFIKQYNKEEK